MNYAIYLLMIASIPFMMSFMMIFYNMFISIEIPLINLYSMNIPISIMLDWTSCLFLSTVMFISSMIIMFSISYIPKSEHKKFKLMLTMFVLSMMILIISDNIIFILLGWDGLGLSSFILVVFYQNYSSAASGMITLLSNRLGDIMILLSISILTMSLNWNFISNNEFSLITLLLLMTAASSKSAQFPFSAWLPAAMAAPTPISALVHSSTLVTAGVYLLIRILNNIHPISISILMISSTATTIYASMSANWEQDMKKIIALSTLSQIAMMMFAISMKSTLLAFFHLIIHALFKSTMFLCAGNMIHTSSYQDMRMMGMLMKKSPLTLSIMGITNMALMGIPFMSGFFSKDSIIEMLISSKMSSILSMIMISSIGMTLSYSIRMIMFSNKLNIKSKSDSIIHKNILSSMSIILIAPTSIFMGIILMWVMNLEQMFIMPMFMKFSIPLMIMLGLILGSTLSFKSIKYIKLGTPSISLWFIHFLTTSPMKLTSSIMTLMNTNDNYWQEMYGPQGLFNYSKMSSKIPNTMTLSMMLLLMMIIMFPLYI